METSRRLLVPSIWSLTLVVSIVLGAYSHSIGHYRPSLTFGYLHHPFPLEISSHASNRRGVC